MLLLLVSATSTACIRKETVSGMKPAGVSSGKTCSLAVLKFYGPYGEAVRNHVYERLAEVQHVTPIATPVDPSLDEVIYDGVYNSHFFQTLEALGADAAITGQVTVTVLDTPGTDQVQVKEGTGHYKKEKNVHGQWVEVEIKRTVIRNLPYVIRKAALTTAYKVIDLRSKGVIATGKLTERYEEKFGGDREIVSLDHRFGNLPPPSATMDELCARLATKLVAKLSHTKLTNALKEDDGQDKLVKRRVPSTSSSAQKEGVDRMQYTVGQIYNNS
jgi:hypothetical protein